MKNKLLVILGVFDIFVYVITEVLLTGSFIDDIYSFNILSVFGAIIALLNILGLYYAYKNKMNVFLILTLLLCSLYGIYQALSIYAITYRFFIIIAGLIICLLSNIKNET